MTRWDGESKESVYERCGMGSQANGVNCGVVEWVKRNTLRWFGYIERRWNAEFVRKVHVSESVGPNSNGRPLGRWRDRVKEHMCERGATRGGGFEQARRECLLGRGGGFSTAGTPLGNVPGGSVASFRLSPLRKKIVWFSFLYDFCS